MDHPNIDLSPHEIPSAVGLVFLPILRRRHFCLQSLRRKVVAMAILSTCCGCCNVRTGSMVTAVVMLIVCGLDLGVRFSYPMNGIETKYTGVFMDGIFALLCIFLIVGVAVNNRYLCLAWVIGAIIYLVGDMLLCIVITVTMFVAKNAMDDFVTVPPNTIATPDAELFDFGLNMAIVITIAVVWVVFLVVACINIYCILVVYSHIQNLRERDQVDDQPGGPPPAYEPVAQGYSLEAVKVETEPRVNRKDTPATSSTLITSA
ncbi:PREDICTED: lysosomal-associated transmembrane protein 4B-like [Branchiostoma belcheri]|uniref:Lysosomal-associated transmembrane protein 4B-like n=1 Tax=Branchiostoma belcheri TaxID=7741 RepID=A0A6P4ZTH9_BRABE|nr:PREDICTED: lysosomal-associated transmembrane protein 4B-like [Branchiostoma belcheri]